MEAERSFVKFLEILYECMLRVENIDSTLGCIPLQ